jgi:hypothetical protein
MDGLLRSTDFSTLGFSLLIDGLLYNTDFSTLDFFLLIDELLLTTSFFLYDPRVNPISIDNLLRRIDFSSINS